MTCTELPATTPAPALSERARRIVLADGTRLAVRPIEPSDVEGLREMFWRLSPTTVQQRFFSPIERPRDRVLRHLATVDHHDREALVAEHEGRIVAVARYEGRRDPDGVVRSAELALMVEDAWQGRGIGRALGARLTARARRAGLECLTATMLGDNRRAVHLFRAIAPEATVEWQDGLLEARVPLQRRAAS